MPNCVKDLVQEKVVEIMATVGYESRYNGDSFEEFIVGDARRLSEDTDRLVFVYLEGGEAEGEHAESVFSVDGVLYKATFRYFSHYGFDLDYLEVFEVEKKEKTVTVYDPI